MINYCTFIIHTRIHNGFAIKKTNKQIDRQLKQDSLSIKSFKSTERRLQVTSTE